MLTLSELYLHAFNIEMFGPPNLSKVQSVDQRMRLEHPNHAFWPGESIGRPPLLLR